MKKVNLTKNIITGLKTRTKNSDEMNPEVAKIGSLWQNFFAELVPTLENPTVPMYGVYTNYESDAMGEFDLLVGVENLKASDKLNTVTLEEGNYLCFESKGEMPQAIIDTWGDIWAYFSDENCTEKRAYGTDFELYLSQSEAEIYIGVE